LAHIVIIHRPESDLGDKGQVIELLRKHRVQEPAALLEQVAGMILLWPVRQLDISSTDIRLLMADNKSPRYLLPEQVYSYIKSAGLYQS